MDMSINYTKFDDGLNVDADPDNMKDSELRRADNVILSADGGFSARGGCKKVNAASFAAECEQLIEWQLSSGKAKTLAVYGNKLYEILPNGTSVLKQALAASRVGYSTQSVDIKRGITDLMVFVDGSEIYEYGGFDWTSGHGTQAIATGDIVRNKPVSTHATAPGVVGRYYRAKAAHGSINLAAADYGDTAKWDDVTDTTGAIPDVVRPVKATYVGHDYTTANGSRSVVKDTIVKNTPVSTHASQPGTVNRYYKAKSNLGIIDLKTADYGNSANWEDVTGTALAALDPIRKCTMLLWYSTGMCLMAAGNPDDAAALYKSLPGEPNNWKSSTERLYPAGGSYGPITGMKMMMRSILVSYKTGWRHYNGTTLTGETTDVTWKTINIPVGSVNDEIVLTPQSIVFLGSDGLYRVDQSILNDDLVVVVQQEFFKNLANQRIKAYFDAMLYRQGTRMNFFDYKLYVAYCQWDYKPSDGYKKIYRGDVVFVDSSGKYYQAKADHGRLNLMTEDYTVTSRWTEVTEDKNSGIPASGASKAFNNSVLVYDWQQKSFVRFRHWQVNDWCNLYEGKMLFASKNYALEALAGYNDIDVDNGSTVPVWWRVDTKPFAFGGKNTAQLRKYIKRMYLFAKQYIMEVSGITLKVVSDYADRDLAANLAESLVWNRAWGTKWGFTETMVQQANFKQIGTRHQVTFEGESLDNPVTIYGVAFDFEQVPLRAASIIDGGDLIAKYDS